MRVSASIFVRQLLPQVRKWRNAVPFIPVPDVAMVEMRMTYDSQKIENTLYFFSAGGNDETNMNQLGLDLLDWWTGHYKNIVVNNVQLREVVVTDLSSDTGLQISVPAVDALGDAGTDPLPSNVAVSVSFRTANRGRSYRGRNYVSGIPVSALVGPNQLSPSYLTSVTSTYEAIPGLITGEQLWGVVSRFHDNDARVEGIFTPITVVVMVDDVVDSMRRRLPGRGT
jgi:hypothetical protein